MSAINTVTNSIVTEPVVKAPRVKKPTLAAKFSRFLIFGYGFVRSLESQGLLTAEGVESALSELKLMSAVDEQTQFYTSVVSQNKETAKVMRKYVAIRNKPPKAPRARKAPAEKKPRATKAPADGAAAKKPRTKKTSHLANDSEADIVSRVVAAATAEPVIDAELAIAVAPVDKKAAKEAEKAEKAAAKEAEKAAAKAAKEAEKAAAKEAKDAEKKAKVSDKKAVKPVEATVALVEEPVVVVEAPVVVAEAPVVAAAAPAEKKKAEKKTAEKKPVEKKAEKKPVEKKAEKKAAPAPVAAAAEEEEEEEIHTQEFQFKGKTYLIDSDNNLYSVDTHEQIGVFDTTANSIIASA
jgi:hypothetical protein